MNSYTQVQNALNVALTDLTAGGELQLLQQIIQMKEELNAKVMEQQSAKTEAIQKKFDQLNEIKQLQCAEIDSKQAMPESLKSEVEALLKQKGDLLAEKQARQQELQQLTKDLSDQKLSKQVQQQQLEQECQLYHQITGVFWESDQAGYVLSEEIAKPIKFAATAEATNELWDLIDM